MIVYNDIKRQFVNDVKDNSIADKILDAIREKGLNAGHDKEYSSWQNSMQFMRNIVDDNEIDDEFGRAYMKRNETSSLTRRGLILTT